MALMFDTMNVLEAGSPMAESRSEQEFKKAWISAYGRFWKKVFCIETEETVAGFPDVMCVDRDNRIQLLEFKVSDRSGSIKFQPTQPAFYRMHPDIPVSVVVLYRKPVSTWIHFDAQFLMKGRLLSPRASVNVKDILDFMHENRLYDVNEGRWSI